MILWIIKATKTETGRLTFSDHSVSFIDADKNRQTISFEQINYLRYTKGNHKFFGMMAGAISGTLSGFLVATTLKVIIWKVAT